MPFRQIPEIGGDTPAGVDPRTGTGYPREWDRVAPSVRPARPDWLRPENAPLKALPGGDHQPGLSEQHKQRIEELEKVPRSEIDKMTPELQELFRQLFPWKWDPTPEEQKWII